jgi:hypothetical protein
MVELIGFIFFCFIVYGTLWFAGQILVLLACIVMLIYFKIRDWIVK